MDENYHDGYALYYLAQSYRKNNDIDNARTYYQKVVELYPNTERSSRAQKYLDEFGTAEADTANPDDAADENTRDTTTGDTGNTDIPGNEWWYNIGTIQKTSGFLPGVFLIIKNAP